MIVYIKSADDISLMRDAGKITAGALEAAREVIAEGVSTGEIDDAVGKFIRSHGAMPSFLGYGGFPASACISVNEQIIHGIPSYDRVLKRGDLVKVDVGAHYRGFHGDAARTFCVGEPDGIRKRLMDAAEVAFNSALDVLNRRNATTGDIGHAVEQSVTENGFAVLRDYTGHGVGKKLHEEPEVPNYGKKGEGCRIYPGMVIAIEPMIVQRSPEVTVSRNGWTVSTKDRGLTAHYENTVAVTTGGIEILTRI